MTVSSLKMDVEEAPHWFSNFSVKTDLLHLVPIVTLTAMFMLINIWLD